MIEAIHRLRLAIEANTKQAAEMDAALKTVAADIESSNALLKQLIDLLTVKIVGVTIETGEPTPR